ncbi:MAG: bifunctional nuclease family protein [Dehalococcoidia bacterium]|nr:bifunctional nuclease family protein [Dehalococcoidia bacterium]
MPEMLIDSIRVSPIDAQRYQRVVILKQKNTNKYLPIWIGPAEADAIAVKLQDVQVPRPLTHDLLGTVIQALGAVLRRVIIWDLSNDTFFAKLVLEVDGKSVEVDSRPSDALALAVRIKVPIFAEQSVLDKAGILLDEKGKPVVSDRQGSGEAVKVTDEELNRLSAFSEFIQNLDMEDLGPAESSKK